MNEGNEWSVVSSAGDELINDAILGVLHLGIHTSAGAVLEGIFSDLYSSQRWWSH